jgi:hypothetical protein
MGYTNDPTELVVFQELELGERRIIKLILRVHMKHAAYPHIDQAIALLDRYYTATGIGVDNGGNGLAVVQELHTLDKYKDLLLEGRLRGYDFGGMTTLAVRDGKEIRKHTKEFMTSLKSFFCFLDGGHRERIPDHAGWRAHVPANRKIRPCSRSDKFRKRLFARADVGNKDARSAHSRILFNGFHQVGILRYRTPYLSSTPGNRLLHHFRTRKQIPAEAEDECRTNLVAPPMVQDVKVLNRNVTAEHALDYILTLVISPYGI